MNSTLDQNKQSYDSIYGARKTFLRYPADWIIRFHNIYMKKNIPTGRVFDYGCGSGNNMKFFMDQGYEVHGSEVTDTALPLVRENCGTSENVKILSPDATRLPYPDNHFDFVVANQVLYYLVDQQRMRGMCDELRRILKPGGAAFFTMMGKRNYYVTEGHAKPIGSNVYELKIGGDHRLKGFHQIFYIVSDEDHLRSIFSMFQPLTVGYFDQAMFDLKSNFHWIFAGVKQ